MASVGGCRIMQVLRRDHRSPQQAIRGLAAVPLEVPAGVAGTDALGAQTSKGRSWRERIPWRNVE